MEKEFRIGVQRLEGDPPAFRLRVEPETSKFTGDVSGGWGPFSVGIGGSKFSSVFYEFDMSEAAVLDGYHYPGREQHLQYS